MRSARSGNVEGNRTEERDMFVIPDPYLLGCFSAYRVAFVGATFRGRIVWGCVISL